tara:strand:- start:18354 stop:18530 length:177 start_codon:yes stop_codon:yes gene_type:complete
MLAISALRSFGVIVSGSVVRSTDRFFRMVIVLDAGVIALHQAPMRFHDSVSAISKIVA